MMIDLHKREFDKAIRTLLSLNLKFLVIDPDGNHHGELKIAVEEPKIYKTRIRKYPHGSLTKYLLPYINSIKEKESVLIPVDQFDGLSLQGCFGSIANKVWGTGNYSTSVHPEGLMVFRKISEATYEQQKIF